MSRPDIPWMRRLPRRPAEEPQAHLTRRIDLVNRARTAASSPTEQRSPGGIDPVPPGRASVAAPEPGAPAAAAAAEPTRRIDLVNRARQAPPVRAGGAGIDLRHPGRSGVTGSSGAASAVPPALEPSLTSLTSSGDATPSIPPIPRHRGAVLILRPPPGVAGVVTLDRQDPVVRLDALQSGIGGLIVRGAERVAWEDFDDRSGVVEASGSSSGDDVPQHGNRSLLRPLGGEVVVTLRHVRRLRRLLVDAPADHAVGLTPWCDGVVRAADPDARLRISVVVVEGRLEIRAEYGLPEAWREALTAMGWSALASVPRPAPDVWA